MAKKSQSTTTSDHQGKHDELDLLHNSLHDELHDKELGDMIITTEESITVTLFEDTPAEEEDEESIDELFGGKKTKKTSPDEDDVEDFDSYFFEE